MVKCAPCHTTQGLGAHNIATTYADVHEPVQSLDAPAGCFIDGFDRTMPKTMGECALAAIMEGWMPMAMRLLQHAQARRVRHARPAGHHRGLGGGRDAGITPLFAGMRTAALFVASCDHRRGAGARARQAAAGRQRRGGRRGRRRRPGEGAGRSSASRSAGPGRAASSSRGTGGASRRGGRLRQGGPATRGGAGVEIARQRRGPRRRRHRGPQGHEADRHARPRRSPSTCCPTAGPRTCRTARPTRSSSSTSPADRSRRRSPSAPNRWRSRPAPTARSSTRSPAAPTSSPRSIRRR